MRNKAGLHSVANSAVPGGWSTIGKRNTFSIESSSSGISVISIIIWILFFGLPIVLYLILK